MQRKIKLLIGSFGMMALILDSRMALTAAANGVDICIRAVIPSLFPFFFISGILSDALKGVRPPFSGQLGRLLRIDPGCVSIWMLGILGGYPVGAQAVAQAVSKGSIHPKDGRRMLTFCNNCGPAFLFGIVGSAFGEMWLVVALWAIHITSSIICAVLTPGEAFNAGDIPNENTPVRNVFNRSIFVMAQVCGWVTLFHVLLSFFEHWFGFLLSREALVALSGLLELSNGCLRLDSINDTTIRFVLCSGMLGFGGLCVTMQTLSLCPKGLQTDLYLPGKLLHCGCSILLSSILMLCVYRNIHIPLLLLGIGLITISVRFLRVFKKRSSFLCLAGV